MYLFRRKGHQELMVLAGTQKACKRANMEHVICGQVGLDMERLYCVPWKQRFQVGLHDLPAERQLQVALPQKTRNRDITFEPEGSLTVNVTNTGSEIQQSDLGGYRNITLHLAL